MSAKRRRWGPWFRLTDEEEAHIQRLREEAEAWKPGMPPPAHSVEEHLEAVRLAMADVKARIQRASILTALWVLALVALVLWKVY